MAGHNSNFDWSLISALLTPTSPIPGDVQFKVVDEADQVIATFEAHKIILALHSDHFKNAFYGSGTFFRENEEGIVVIKETTKESFEDFLGFNYEKKIEFEKKTLAELYEILNLAEKYQVKELKVKVVNFIKSFPLSIHNVVKVAATTQKFSHFKEESEGLYKNCVAFLGKHFADVPSVLNFVSKHEDEAMVVVKLLKDVERKKNQPCSNCKQRLCRNRSSIMDLTSSEYFAKHPKAIATPQERSMKLFTDAMEGLPEGWKVRTLIDPRPWAREEGKTVRHYLSPDCRVLKTGQGVMEYLRLGGEMDTEAVLDIAKNILHISDKKINALLSM